MTDHIVSVDDNFNFPPQVVGALGKQLANADAGSLIRVDTTVGKRIFINDGVTEHMIFGETGARRVPDLYTNGAKSIVAGEVPTLSRSGNIVTLAFTGKVDSWVSGDVFAKLPAGFYPVTTQYLPDGYAGATTSMVVNGLGEIRAYANGLVSGRWMWVWVTKDPWPTVNPGTAM